ncbi:saccharopine dehydrogenase family protein [Saliterribacillus persicus]|uniref:Saccharopine dehydrogenase-like NADP-dependent oxidoreductase n=1 Tax=Saliterribacillus persicus TaxID=930114 RepID=A0A368XCY2_9BACI|nr:saccharopine dehydrogenase NADP-binding domain-containing protein [Saliterribacillus persicus]RCW65823.1 saccharopine dehydrogenase-like NADP-dependent oxidoreductase [Saliterribacillus persicus]
MSKNVLIVGGYGMVGGKIAIELLKATSWTIYIGGRNLDKAKDFCKEKDLHPLLIDVTQPLIDDQILKMDLVIMCLDQENTAFAKYCLESGVNYVDITANYPFMKEVEQLSHMAQNATALFSVGFAPGLSNLLAKDTAGKMDRISELHITIMLGLGEKHGVGAIEWLLDQLNEPYELQNSKTKETVYNFSQKKRTTFQRFGSRSSYLFNFSDQHTLRKSYPGCDIRTHLTFDVEWVNRLVHLFQVLRLTSLLKQKWMRKWIVKSIQKSSLGSDICAIKVEGRNDEKGKVNEISQVMYAHNEAAMTACITALVARKMMDESLPSGVYHIDHFYRLEDFIPFIPVEKDSF